jgi:3'-phosphoadenosine 5'-phosphosulfate sulfotransferase (PAPS reductase)/FAD synthetase
VKRVVCYSGGHSSGLVAVEVARRFPEDEIVLLNHDLAFWTEDADIKRFKRDVAAYLGMPVTFATYANAQYDQFDVTVAKKAFKVDGGQEFCTSVLKTEPFMKWLAANASTDNAVIYYGFDSNEKARIQRRSSILGALGWKTDYPLALWTNRTIVSTLEVGIPLPNTYGVFKHANCVGCLKAGWQHWYVVYCTRPDIWLKGKWAEDEIGYAIHHDESGPVYLEDMEEQFERMKAAGIPATEHIQQQRFWAQAKKIITVQNLQLVDMKPCECTS